MHAGNIMVDKKDNVFIIDFGYSCITMPPPPDVGWNDLPDGIPQLISCLAISTLTDGLKAIDYEENEHD